MRPTTKQKAALVAVACAAAGAVAGIAGAAASTSSSQPPRAERGWFHFFGPRGLGGRELRLHRMLGEGRAVHAQVVVLDKAGTGFITVTEDNGTLQSVSGDQLTIKEAVNGVTYRTVTLTIPSGATVMRNFQSSTLSALHSGDRVRVAQSSEGSTVFAIDPSSLPTPPAYPGPAWRSAPPTGAAPAAPGA